MASPHMVFDMGRFVEQEAVRAGEEDSDASRPPTCEWLDSDASRPPTRERPPPRTLKNRAKQTASELAEIVPPTCERFDSDALHPPIQDGPLPRAQTNRANQSASELATETSIAYSRPPARVRVSGASHYFRPECNGVFYLLRMHNDRPLYRATSGAIVYFDRHWKLNHESSTTGWSFVSKGGAWLVPPFELWVPVDEASGEPVLAHVHSDRPQVHLPPLLPPIEPSPRIENGPPPTQLLVSGSLIPECNSAYSLAKTHNYRPLYRAPSGAILYFHIVWRINVDGRTSGWAFSAPGGAAPPENGWASVDPRGQAPRVEVASFGASISALCSPDSPSKTPRGSQVSFQDTLYSASSPSLPSKTPRRPWHQQADVSSSPVVKNSDYEYHKHHGSNLLYTVPLRRRLVEQWLSESREPVLHEAIEKGPP